MTTLSPETASAYLIERGLLEPGVHIDVVELGGGVSCIVLGVTTPSGKRMVIKQALPRLRVADEWLATPRRSMAEADALSVAFDLTPQAVPRLLDRDPDEHALTIEYAADTWRDWKSRLLDSDVDTDIAAWLGSVLAEWHSGTLWDAVVEAEFDNGEAFEQLRIDPYHRTVAQRHPELKDLIDRATSRLHRRRRCLVHGDFSPKNVLVGPDGRWVIDFEVAHYGDPCFDVAFMLNHLFLKAMHRSDAARRFEAASIAFYGAYTGAAAREVLDEFSALMCQTGCLMLARVDGKSPAEYLRTAERDRAWRIGLSLGLDPPESLEVAWKRVLLADGK
jgi:5-methylthioribose kinase